MGSQNFVAAQKIGYCKIPAVDMDAGVNVADYLTANLPAFSAKGGTSAGPYCLLLISEVQAFRWKDDSPAATATNGMPTAVGQPVEYDATGLSSLTVMSASPGCILHVSVYRQRS